MKSQRYQNEHGVALILTLTILAVVLILLLAFITSMRTERISAKAFSDLSKTKALAEGAVDEAVALLQGSTPSITITPPTSYITAPGVVYTWSGGAWTPTQLFSSGIALNLNNTNAITGTGPVYPAGVPLQVGWVPVLSTGANPQLIGRFAYWVDDESTKVNLNTAQSRLNDPNGFTPAAIDLSQLFTSAGDASPVPEANAIINYTSTRPLDSIESMKLTQPVIANAPSISTSSFSNNEFFVTANATSPDLTPWGTKRLNLNSLLGPNPTRAQKIAAAVTITTALSDPNLAAWYGGAQTFATKYPNVQQIAANIVDYITKDNIPTDSGTFGDLTAPAFLGLKQTPYLNELVISNTFQVVNDPPATPQTGNLFVSSTITAELWYMYTNSAGWNAPLGTSVTVAGIPLITLSQGASGTISLSGAGTITISPVTSMLPNPGTTTAGTYMTVVTTITQPPIPVADTTVPVNATLGSGIVTAILTSPLGGRMDYAQVKMGLLNIKGPVPVAPVLPLTLVWQSQCNDPRVKPINNTWAQIANGLPNTLGFPNSTPTLNMTAGNGTISGDNGATPGDLDISCHVVSGSRQRGTMYPSELAYIHTGVPWRTFYLEPQPAAESTFVPDWLAVDLFSATDVANVAGRMNVNVLSKLNPNGNPNGPDRVQPLSALLAGNPPALIATVTNSIYSFTLDNSPTLTSFVPAADKYFTTAGQICEVQGLADIPGPSKSVREAPAQDIINLVTPRSDTFTIWAMAQGIKKVAPPLKTFIPGTDLITGEVKIQAVVQRYEDPSTAPPTVRFRTLYYRYIYQ